MWLLYHSYLNGEILDYGCGYGKDADILGCDAYDPHFFPDPPIGHKYDTIICNYVLNVVEPDMWHSIIHNIELLLTSDGFAFITVRRDVKKDYTNPEGSKQFVVKLDLPILKETSQYCIYETYK